MIFSDSTIIDYINRGRILILPEFDLKDVRPVGLRLHLGKEILLPKPNQTVDIDSDQEVFFDHKEIPKAGYLLKPGEFILGSTYESFQVPKNVVCHIEGRSTVARLGLSIHCTSGIIDGNFQEPRTVVLEIKNNGPLDIILKPNMAIAMLVFSELSSEIAQKAQDQYKGQRGVIPPNLKIQKR